MKKNIILVRSTPKLIEDDVIGYGWINVKFKDYGDGKDLINRGFKARKIDFGRKRKQIERFQNIKEGDIVIVPVHKAIAIGIATGDKIYVENPNVAYSANRIRVKFYRNDSKKIIYVLRSELENNFEKRLKIRTTIANLNDFRENIERIVSQIENGNDYKRSTIFANKEEEAKNNFIEAMFERMQTGKNLTIDAGGAGLEKLIKEIFEKKGYDTLIPSKNKKSKKESPIADVDVVAYKSGELSTKGELILIQAKHHSGTTNNHGVEQLKAVEDYTFGEEEFSEDEYTIKKILITTAKIDKQPNSSIHIIDGQMFAEWLYDNLALLSKKTKVQLGISDVPTLI
jgi:restriction system protein